MRVSLELVVAAALLVLTTVQVSVAEEAYKSTSAYVSTIQFMTDNGITTPAQINLRAEEIKAHIATISTAEMEIFGAAFESSSTRQGLLKNLENTKEVRYDDPIDELRYMLYLAVVYDSLPQP